MSLLTSLALSRRPVTVLVIILVLVGGVLTFNNLQRELFPEIEFPNILIITSYPSANPEAVERDVSEPIENSISGIAGLKEIKSTSSENRSLVIATFEFGEDMEEAERTIEGNVGSIRFPDGVEDSIITRISSDTFPVLQLSVVGDRDVPSLQRIVDDLILPAIKRVDGVFRVDVAGNIDEQVIVSVDSDKLEDFGLSLFQVSSAISDNNVSIP
ncbi:MAG: efflux RND transporter permease subunit, partial [Chloroflexi bacterium]|nr:efflux RND transporter permease subunit [Chloroflexota bacterium]